jgi:LytS/YehU family sensor histidine kinase
MAMLERLSLLIARRIDAVRTIQERYERNIREQEMLKLAAEAELRALRAQINPHFLFNALTTIGYLIQTSPGRAFDVLMRLSGLLRMVLRSNEGLSTIGEEIDLIESYLDIERARFEDRLRTHIDVPWELRSAQLPALLLQPLVENAVKHGIAGSVSGGEIRIEAALIEGRIILMTVTDTGQGSTHAEMRSGRNRGVGLTNVERRLECLQDPEAKLIVESVPGAGTRAEVRLTAHWKGGSPDGHAPASLDMSRRK